jgi:hypothetical protein
MVLHTKFDAQENEFKVDIQEILSLLRELTSVTTDMHEIQKMFEDKTSCEYWYGETRSNAVARIGNAEVVSEESYDDIVCRVADFGVILTITLKVRRIAVLDSDSNKQLWIDTIEITPVSVTVKKQYEIQDIILPSTFPSI